MKLVGSTLGDQVDARSSGATEFSRIQLRLDFKLLDGVWRRHSEAGQRSSLDSAADGIDPIDQHTIVVIATADHGEATRSIAEGGGIGDICHHPWLQGEKLREITGYEREALDHTSVEHLAERGRGRLEECRVPSHGDLLRRNADHQ